MSLYVAESGTRGLPTIVFLHGVGASGWMWWKQIAALRDFHCLNVDLPGHGKSQDVAWLSLTDTAHQIASIIQSRATHGKAHVVGLSLGGYIALMLLEHHANLVGRVVVSGVTATPMPNRHLIKPQLVLMSIMKLSWISKLQAKLLKLPPDMQTAFAENLSKMSIATYHRIIKEVVDFSVPATRQQINNPTLITAGGNESNIILQAVKEIPKIMPNAHGYIAPGLRHGWNVEAPDLFTAMIRAWVMGTPLPAQLRPPT